MSKEPSVCVKALFQGQAWQKEKSKMCCDCCKLGLLTASRGSSCELQGLLMGTKCLYTAKDCCGKNTTAEIQPEIQLPTEQECCQNGRDWAQGGLQCTNLGLSLTSLTCRIAQEQCCAAAVEDRLCEKGIQMAKEQWVCERPFFQGEPWETEKSKMCCDCCMLGLVSESRGSSCELQGLLMGRKCLYTAKVCCGKNTTEEIQPAPVTEKPQASVTPKPGEELDPCIDTLCSQLCEGNGTCACLAGYQLDIDGVNCEDVNECLTDSHNCVIDQVCINTEGSFHCQRETSCGPGYELKDDNTCQDINECALETHNCGPDLFCNNTEGSFLCRPKVECSGGFIRDAVGSCIDVNECEAHTSSCPHGPDLYQHIGLYTCRRSTVPCGRGYRLTQDGSRCEDVDECRTGNVCVGQGCLNLVGTYRCECKTGFTFNSFNKLCKDTNECRHYPGRLCAHKCENTPGSYQCSCSTGFKLSPDKRNCEDVNECDADSCSQECANVYGSYQCYCRRGYQLSEFDGITCEDIDECALALGGYVCSYHCSNAQGSFYCNCPPTGYTLAYNGHTCHDIDECAVGSHTCSFSENCFNIQGGFRCLSFRCPQNFRQAAYRLTKDDLVVGRCIKVCKPYDTGCNLDPVHFVTHTALSLPTIRDFNGPKEIVSLQTAAVANNAHLHGATQVSFDILVADDRFSFDVVKRSYNGMVMGTVRQVKPIVGPRDIVLEVAMNYVKSGHLSHRNIVVINVFISKFWF
ncbi:fibulin-1-like isoform X2 [Cyclopterus lumpus]|nr:fibulin-1-like isoform X2 [Cyclopterus lumpus]